MIEALFVLSLLTVLGAVAFVPAETLVVLSLGMAVLGLLGGAGAGFVYHIRLRAALARLGTLPPRWWWNPVRYHGLVPDAFRAMKPWFVAGAAGFVVAVGGCLLAFAGLVKAIVAPPF